MMLDKHIRKHKYHFETALTKRAKYLESLLKKGIVLTGSEIFECSLDIGCGTGDFTKNLAKYSKSTHGYDFSRKNINLARKKFPELAFKVKNVYELKIKDEFDLVTAFSFLEHIEHLDKAIMSIYNSQKKKGVIIIQIPNPYFFVELHTYIPFNFLIPSFIRWNLFPKLGYSKDPVLKSNLSISNLKKTMSPYYEIVHIEKLVYPREIIPDRYQLIYDFLKKLGAFRIVPFGYLVVGRKK